jgi:hypothetical protein
LLEIDDVEARDEALLALVDVFDATSSRNRFDEGIDDDTATHERFVIFLSPFLSSLEEVPECCSWSDDDTEGSAASTPQMSS